jgi:hypothetical protein
MEKTVGAFNAVDVAAAVVVLFTAFQGFRRRLSGEVARAAAAVAALAVGLACCGPLGTWMDAHTRLDPDTGRAVAFVAAAIAAGAVMIVLRISLKRLMQVAFHPAADRVGGVAAGVARGAAVVLIVVLAMNLWPNDYLNRVFGVESWLGRHVQNYVPAARDRIASVSPIEEGLEKAKAAVGRVERSATDAARKVQKQAGRHERSRR